MQKIMINMAIMLWVLLFPTQPANSCFDCRLEYCTGSRQLHLGMSTEQQAEFNNSYYDLIFIGEPISSLSDAHLMRKELGHSGYIQRQMIPIAYRMDEVFRDNIPEKYKSSDIPDIVYLTVISRYIKPSLKYMNAMGDISEKSICPSGHPLVETGSHLIYARINKEDKKLYIIQSKPIAKTELNEEKAAQADWIFAGYIQKPYRMGKRTLGSKRIEDKSYNGHTTVFDMFKIYKSDVDVIPAGLSLNVKGIKRLSYPSGQSKIYYLKKRPPEYFEKQGIRWVNPTKPTDFRRHIFDVIHISDYPDRELELLQRIKKENESSFLGM